MDARNVATALLLNIPTVSKFALTHRDRERSRSWHNIKTERPDKDTSDNSHQEIRKSEFVYDEEDCCWKSAANRVVRLENTNINHLCDAERETLKVLAVQKLAEEGFSNITIPKEKRVSPISRWRQLLPLIRKYKGLPEPKSSVTQPQKPVFAIDLCQAIENEKAVERAHEIALKKLEIPPNEDGKDQEDSPHYQKEKKLSKSYYDRRNSDPLLKIDLSNGDDKPQIRVENCVIPVNRTISCENDIEAPNRTSRLIEALCLSSTSASSVCVLDRDSEFKAPAPQVPKVMRHTADFIAKHGLNCVHIFRNEGSKIRVKKMREEYDSGCSDVITDKSNPYDVAALFKDFIRKLPEPLMTRELYSTFLNIGKIEDKELYNKLLKLLILLLPVPNRDTLEVVLRCLRRVADHAEDVCDDGGNVVVTGNKMDAKSIAIIMAPNILYRYKGYKTTNQYEIEEENNSTIDIVHALIQLTNELFVIEKEIYDEVLKILLETDPESVDYVLRKKSARTNFSDMLKSFDEAVTVTKENMLRPQSLKLRKISNREEESDLKKANSFNQGKIPKRRHLSSITRPDPAFLDSPEKGGLPKFSRNILRMSLGSRESKSRNSDSKYSPRTSPHSSKRSIFRRDKNSNPDICDLEGSIPEHHRTKELTSTSELHGIFKGKKSPSLTSSNNSENGSRNENLDINHSSESIRSASSHEKIKMTPPVKDRRRKISLPTFLQSNNDRGKCFVPYKTPSVEIEVFSSPSEEHCPAERISEVSVDYDEIRNSNTDCAYEGKKLKPQHSIDWTREEDWPQWQLEVVSSGGFTSPETTL